LLLCGWNGKRRSGLDATTSLFAAESTKIASQNNTINQKLIATLFLYYRRAMAEITALPGEGIGAEA
jgi:hypothetical protein